MSNNKNNNIMNDDEYQFPKDEYLQSSGTATADHGHSDDFSAEDHPIKNKSGSDFFERLPILKNKKLYFFIVFAVLIFSGLHMMHRGMSKEPAPTPLSVADPIQAPQPDSQLLNQLDTLKSDQVSSQDAMTQLQNHLSNLDSKLSSIEAANTQLAQSVTMLTAQMQLLAADVQKNTEKLAAKSKKVAKGKLAYHPKPITYTLKAVVPGRAWIDASNGYSYSLSVGDRIAQYGKITAIDDNGGHVYTTSGKVIAYGPNDE